MVSTFATQSRSASLIASLRVAAAGADRDDLGTEQPHPGDVQRLPPGVLLAHVDHAFETQVAPRPSRVATPCWPAPVSAITRVLPIRLVEQRLAEHVVDLVRAGVVEVLALEQTRAPPASAVSRRASVSMLGRPAYVPAVASSSPRNAGRRRRPDQASSSSSSAAISASGTNRPPYAPKWPARVGARPGCGGAGAGRSGQVGLPATAGCAPRRDQVGDRLAGVACR